MGSTHTVVPSTHTVVVKGWRGEPLITVGLLISSTVHSGCVWPHRGYVYCFMGGTPDKHGALERCFPVGFYRGIDPHGGFVCSHSGCLSCKGRWGRGLVNMGVLKLFSSRAHSGSVCPHIGDVYCFLGGCLLLGFPNTLKFSPRPIYVYSCISSCYSCEKQDIYQIWTLKNIYQMEFEFN